MAVALEVDAVTVTGEDEGAESVTANPSPEPSVAEASATPTVGGGVTTGPPGPHAGLWSSEIRGVVSAVVGPPARAAVSIQLVKPSSRTKTTALPSGENAGRLWPNSLGSPLAF